MAVDLAHGALTYISEAAAGTPVVLGVQRQVGYGYITRLCLLAPYAEVVQTYDQHPSLVPFWRILPFGDILGRDRTGGIAAHKFWQRLFPLVPGAELMELGGLGAPLPLICYEAAFAATFNAATGASGVSDCQLQQ